MGGARAWRWVWLCFAGASLGACVVTEQAADPEQGSQQRQDDDGDNGDDDNNGDSGSNSDDDNQAQRPPDPCEGVACGGVGACHVEDGEPFCSCPQGYLADGLGCAEDFDEDQVPDEAELAIARDLSPVLIFSFEEMFVEREVHWSVRIQESTRTISVFYALSYHTDGGDPDTGFTAHLGDSEFIVVELRFDEGGYLDQYRTFLSSHFRASTDASAWFGDDDLQFQPSGDEEIHPLVWVAANKHANYNSREACEVGAFWQDSCDDEFRQGLVLLADRNLGHSRTPLVDEVVRAEGRQTFSEFYWTRERFCGWQVPEGGSREGCAPLDNAYGLQLRLWELGEL